MSDDIVYRTRIVEPDFRGDNAINHFADPEEGKRWLEAYLEDWYEVEPTEWYEERSPKTPTYSMRVDDLRAVVKGCRVLDSADDVIEKFRESAAEVKGGDQR